MVDLEGKTHKMNSKTTATLGNEDKELLMSIEELEKKFNIDSTAEKSLNVSNPNSNISNNYSNTSDSTPVKTNTCNPSSKFVRPDVTWLRRTEYISSVKNNPNGSNTPNLSVDEAKAILNEPVKFEEIVREVNETFSSVKDGKHPNKNSLKLVQSFPIKYLSHSGDHVHCLFSGDNLANENSLLKLSTDDDIISLYNPDPIDPTIFKSSGEFDIQKASESASKSFVVMLPTGSANEFETAATAALLAKIN